jgi:serralysin
MGDITGNGTAVTGLGGAAGYGEVMLPRGDDTVAQVNVSAVFESGFSIGGAQYGADRLFISTDGLISFGTGFSGVAANASAIAAPFFAIFNADVDTRLDGEGAESGGIWLDVDTVQDCVTITWDHVGFYRRNATATNTFQMQLFDRGNGSFDVVYRYQDITWTSGDLQGGWGGLGGTPGLIGHRAGTSGAASFLPASGVEAAQLGLPDALGNTGLKGLWVYSFGASSVITGTALADTLTGTTANDTMRGLGGADVLIGSAGADLMDGGPGLDRVDYRNAPTGILLDRITPSANTGQAASDTFLSIETFAGSGFHDTLRGSGGADRFLGANGSDLLDGRAGLDSLFGGAGRDSLSGGDGNDLLDGGDDNDSLLGGNGDDALSGSSGADTLSAGAGNDTLTGGNVLADGADVLWGGSGRDQITGNAGNDTLRGDSGADTLVGDDGDDLLNGGTDADRLNGGAGRDHLNGDAGNDLLDGGLAEDRLTGGLGADAFHHAGTGGQGSDWAMDFSHAQGDHLIFGIAGALKSDFSVTFQTVAGAGNAAIQEAMITYLPQSRLIWIVVDGADQAAIMIHSSMNSFDLL